MPPPLTASRAQQIGALSTLMRELAVPASVLSSLLAHAEAVRTHAKRLGLVAPGDVETIVSRHTADSLLFALAQGPQAGERWVDVGTGAGFPGLVLAICWSETWFTLVEPQQKRAGFLEIQCAELGLSNAEVIAAKAEMLPGGFDVAVARALAEPALTLEALVRLIEPRGTAIVAVGERAVAPAGVDDVDVARAGVDSPGRLFMIRRTPGEA